MVQVHRTATPIQSRRLALSLIKCNIVQPTLRHATSIRRRCAQVLVPDSPQVEPLNPYLTPFATLHHWICLSDIEHSEP